jgi:hypothetical protein
MERKELTDAFVDYVAKSSISELEDFLKYLQKTDIVETFEGILLASFVNGYLFGLRYNTPLSPSPPP